MVGVSRATRLHAIEPTTILNRCHRFRGFVYEHARFSNEKKRIECGFRGKANAVPEGRRKGFPGEGERDSGWAAPDTSPAQWTSHRIEMRGDSMRKNRAKANSDSN